MKALSNIWRTVALSACTAVVMSGMIACSAEDNIVKEEQTPAAQQEGLKVTLTATFDDGAATRGVSFGSDGSSSNSTFSVGDKIYVYNETQGWQDRKHLTVSSISDDGKTADFSGTLNGGYDPNDALKLYYNVSYYNEDYRNLSRFNYQDVLDGSASSASACDYAIANATVGSVSSGTLTLSAPVTLQKMQSVFRQRLTFKDTNEGQPITPNIVQLTVSSLENKLNRRYFLNGDVDEMPIAIPNPTIDGNKDIYLALRFSDGSTSSDALTFTAIASNGIVYVGKKTAPSGGLKNGKYYYGNLTLVKSNDKVLPTISWYNVKDGVEVTPDANNTYKIKPQNDYIDIGLSGISKGYCFQLWSCSNTLVRLNNFTAKWDGNDSFIQAYENDLILDLTGSNTINCRNWEQCIYSEGGLKLSGNGTLTVTSNKVNRVGINGDNYTITNNNNAVTDGTADVSTLAAPGSTVTRSAMTNNNNGTYTWTYTVTTP